MTLEIYRRTYKVSDRSVPGPDLLPLSDSHHNYLALVETSATGAQTVLAELHGTPDSIFDPNLVVYERTPADVDLRLSTLADLGSDFRDVGGINELNQFDVGVSVFSGSSDASVIRKWDEMRHVGFSLSQDGRDYNIDTRNSNTAERHMSESTGLPWFQPPPANVDTIGADYVAPGSETVLDPANQISFRPPITYIDGVPSFSVLSLDSLLNGVEFVPIQTAVAIVGPDGGVAGYQFSGQNAQFGDVVVRVVPTGEFDALGNEMFSVLADFENLGGGPGRLQWTTTTPENADGTIDYQLVKSSGIAGGDGYVVERPDQPPVTGTAIGEAFGSALGNYIAGDNAFAQVAIGAVSSTFFGSIGGTIEELFEGDSFDEAASQGFANFGDRLGAKAANLAIGQISSFIVGELIGGDSFAADFGRATANYFVSSTISQAVGFEVAGNAFGSFSVGGFTFDPITTIASFFASQLASSIVTPATQEAALVSSALSGIAGAFGATLGTVGSIVPIIGTFVGVLVGQVVGTLLGNILFGDPGTPHAFASVVLQPDGTLDVPGVGWSENGGSVQDAINIANGVVSGLNPIIELLGGDARFTGSTGTNWYLEIGYRAGEGFQWNKPGVGYVGIVAFEDLFADIANEVVTNRLSGGDAFGRRVYHYGTWTNAEELMVELTVAADYRSYLENRAVIDFLISDAPDTAFSIGWLTTIAQAVNMGLTNPDALQNKIDGTAGNDVITGTAYNDEIIGGAGNDTLDGGIGNDLLRGGAGNDILRGGAGQDSVSYAEFTSGVVIDLVALAVTGAGGTDTLESIERAFGSQANDTIIGSAGAEILSGLGGADAIQGGAGDDTIEGGAGADGLDGGAGFDLASYAGSNEGVHVTLQANASTPGTGAGGDAQGDSLLGFEGIIGSLHSDILVGNAEDNLLIGNSGNDFLEGGAGADELLGGDGADFAVYTNSNAGITVNLETGEATGGHAEGDTFDSIEYVIGSDYNDTITGDAFGNVIEGGLGADILDGGEGMDAISYANSSAGIHIDLVNQTVRSLDVTALVQSDAQGDTIANFEHVIGTNFDDEIIVGHDNAVILAGAGDDVITPFSGNVSIDGGDGYDTADFSRIDAGGDFQPLYAAGLFTGSQWQDVQVFQGSDIYAVWDQALQGAAVDENSFGANTNQYDIKLHSIEMLRATEFDDRIAFNDIGQHVDAAGGNDQMIGQSGNDVFYGGTGDDALDGAGGADVLHGDAGNDVLHGGAGADVLYGGAGNDTLQGDGQFNAAPYEIFLTVDTGPQGNDYLDGGAGDDILRGGGGNDVYRFGRGYGSDTIIDSNYVAGPPAGKLNLPTAELAEAGNDTLVFADDILPTDIEATSIGDTLVLKIKGTSDQITITGMGHSFTAIESLQFDALGLTVDLTGLGAAGAASVVSSIGNDAELFVDGGTFTPHLATNVTEIAGLTDFNNDGTLDVAGVNGGNAFVAFGSGDAFSYAQVDSKGNSIPSSGIFHAVGTGVGVESETADIDGDGAAEIVSWRSYGTNQLDTRFSVSADGIAPNVSAALSHTPLDWVDGQTFHGGDVDGNGREELVRVRSFSSIPVYVETVSLDNNGAYTTSTQNVSVGTSGLTSATPYTWQLADINADGRDDLIVIAASATYVALAQPTAFGTLTQTSAGITYDVSNVTKYATGDIDGDGYEDLIKINQSTISVAFGSASGILTTDPAFNVNTPTSVQDMFTSGASFEVHLADKNGDGRDDVYVAGTSGVVVLTNNFAHEVGTAGNDSFVGGADSDVFAGLAGNDSLVGGGGRDGLRGDEGADTLNGGAGNDYLEGGAGNDTLIGGADHDRAIYHSGAQYYTITQSGGSWIITDINGADGNDGTDTLTGVEEAYFDGRIVKLDGTNNSPFATGPAQGQVIDPGTAYSYTLPAGLFHDVDAGDTLSLSLVMADGRALPSWLIFNAATRTLSGTPGTTDADVLDLLAVASDGSAQASAPFRIAVRGSVSGTDEDDTLDGLGIYERMSAGAGNDTLKGSAGADILDGGAGVDTIDYSGSFFGINASLTGAVGTSGDAWGDQLSNIENIIGTKHADVIYGSSADNYIDAGTGDDWIDAGAGNDTIKVGSRSAYVIGGSGWDIVDYSGTPAASNGAGMFVNFSLPPGSILTPSLEGVEELIGTNWADVFTGDANINVFRGGLGDDIFAGWGGNDTLEGGAGADNLDGGDGSDTVSYATSDAGVTVNLTAGSASGGHAEGDLLTSFENVTGSDHNDLLYGDAGGNQLRGAAGHDHLWGYGGADYLDGGAGSDYARYDYSTAGVNVNLSADTATGGHATGDVLDNIEHLIGSAHADLLTGDGNSNHLYGLGGNDTLYGLAGNDVLLGGAGADALYGGDGIDRAQYSSSTAGVTINLFLTTAQSGGYAQGDILSSIEDVFGSNHADTISGDNSANTLWGYGGNDAIYGNGGNDVIYGQDGNDTLIGQGGADHIDGGAGTDLASYHGSTVGVTINLTTGEATGGTATGDTLVSIEDLQGSNHNDVLTGDAGANRLLGLAGNDTLEGGAGADTLDGGDGIDTVSYSASSAAVLVNLGMNQGWQGDAEGDTFVGIENFIGSVFDDQLVGDSGVNVLAGGVGDDILNGAGGADHLDGGSGSDWAWYSLSNAGVNVNLQTGVTSGGHAIGDTFTSVENLHGSSYADTLAGDAGDNILQGGAGADTLDGGAGNDVLHAVADGDMLDGGAGTDTANYTNGTRRVIVDLAAGQATSAYFQSTYNAYGAYSVDTGWSDQDTYPRMLGDVNGDGIDDVVGFATDGVYVSQGNANGVFSSAYLAYGAYGVSSGWSDQDTYPRMLGDVNGDGIDDVVGFATDGVYVSQGNANGVFSSAYLAYGAYGATSGWPSQDTYPRMLGDVNGDGIDDVVGFATDGVYVSQGNASGVFSSAYLAYGAYGVSSGWSDQDTYPRMLGDVNGDGIDDVVGFATDGVYVSQGNASGVFSSAYLAYGAYGVSSGWPSHDTYPRMLGDVNGDGIDDVVAFASDGVYVSHGSVSGYFGTALKADAGFSNNSGWSSQNTYPRMLGDVNGDGVDDIAGFATGGVYVGLGVDGAVSGGTAKDTLADIENVNGTSYADTLLGDAGVNVLSGQAGDDVLEGGAGADSLDGGAGVDWAQYYSSAAGVSVNLMTGVATGGDAEGDTFISIENLYGSAHNDTLIGDAGVNVLSGHSGNDTLVGGAGADTLDGGDGIDTASYAGSSAGVLVSLLGGTGGEAQFGPSLTGTTEFSVSAGWTSQDAAPRLLGDVNGDGRADIVGFKTGGAYVALGQSDGTFSGAILGHAGYGDAAFGWTSQDAAPRLLGDVNGDGRADIVGFKTGGAYVALGQSDGTFSGAILGHAGYGDAAYGWTSQDATPRFLGDVNGDGRADIIGKKDTGTYIALGQADGTFSSAFLGSSSFDPLFSWADQNFTPQLIADVNGDGNADIVGLDADSVSVALASGVASTSGVEDTLLNIENVVGTAFSDTLIGDENANTLTGESGADTLMGLGGADVLYGGAGTDLLFGGEGADHIDGGDGYDSASYQNSASAVAANLATGSGSLGEANGDILVNIESLYGSAYDDTLIGDAGTNSLWGGAGADTLDGGAGDDIVSYASSTAGVTVDLLAGTASGGHAEGDVLTNLEHIVGSSYDDQLWGNADANTLSGGGGDDNLISGAGATVLDGGGGTDWANYTRSAFGVTVNLETGAASGGDAAGDTLVSIERLWGSVHNDVLTGDAGANYLGGYQGDDVLHGGAGADELYGHDGNDVLEGGAGADTLDGGAGNDTVSYVSSSAGVTVDLFWTTAQTGAGDAVGDILSSIENVVGSSHGDVLYAATGGSILTGGDGDDNLVARAGVDTLDGGGGVDWANYSLSTAGLNVDLSLTTAQSGGFAEGDILIGIEKVYGSNVDDTIRGHATDDYLVGYGGNDVLEGRAGADILDGGDGVDTASYAGSAAGVTIDIRQPNGAGVGGDAEGDVLVGIENVTGSSFGDTLWGNDQANVLIGGAGNDSFVGGAGNDTIHGGAGNDTLRGQAGADVLDGGDGVDTVRYDWDAGPVTVNLETGIASGGDAEGDTLISIENLVGSALNDVLTGDAGNNSLSGLDGDDLLSGGAGSNTLDGGLGSDTAVFSGNFGDYALSISGSGGTVSGLGETSSLANIETLSFADRTVTLDALNNAPILVSAISNQTVFRDVPLSLDVSGNFVDIDAGDVLSFSATLADGSALPAWMSIDAATGILSGTATTSDMGLLAVKVMATDGSGATAETLFDLDVTRTNVAPVAGTLVDQAGSEGTALAFTIPGTTFTDADTGEILTLNATQLDGSALPAWLSFDAATGAFSGTPTNTSAGVLSLAVTATDTFGETAIAAFDLTIANVNDAPTAANTTGSVDEGQVYTLDLATLTADLDGDALTYTLPTVPGTGTASVVGSVLTYTSVVGGFGPASIGYQVNDGNGGLATGTVDLTVNNINFAPTISAVNGSVNEGQSVSINLASYASDLDGDALTYTLTGTPSVGSASITGSTLTYNSVIGGFGAQALGFTVSDGQGGSVAGTANVGVNNINFAPTASNSSGTVNEGQSFSINLAGLTSDVDGDALTYSINSGPAAGSASISGAMLTYTSVNGQPGNYNIGYTVSDGQGGTANANISANILDINYAPTAVDNATGAYTNYFFVGLTTASALLSNDTDPDGDTLTITGFSNFVGVNSVRFDPANPDHILFNSNVGLASHYGSFVYTISDGHGHSSSATFSYDFTYEPLPPPSKPIVFDLDGDGLELVNADESDIFFDLNGDGEAEDTGWVDSDDALLAYDRNDDGLITDHDEVSFVDYKEGARTDLEGLHAFDTNGDGVLDTNDAEFGSFNIWQDVNQNGVSDAGELRSLTAAGIASIALVSDETVRVAGDNVSFGIGQFTRTDGSTGNFSDTGFGTGQGLGEAPAGLDHVADESGLIAGADVIQLNASLEDVLEGHFESSLLMSPGVDAGSQPTGDQNIAGLVSAMAAFDPKTGGEAQINTTDDDHQAPAIAAWVA